MNATKRAEIVLNDARFTELDVNLFYFRQVYRGILEHPGRPPGPVPGLAVPACAPRRVR